MLERFGVECTKISYKPYLSKGQVGKSLYFDICRNKKNILRFKDQIGFLLERDKIKKLNEACKILKTTLKRSLDRGQLLALRANGCSMRKIANRLGVSKSTIFRHLSLH